eukprot:s176_g25.t1
MIPVELGFRPRTWGSSNYALLSVHDPAVWALANSGFETDASAGNKKSKLWEWWARMNKVCECMLYFTGSAALSVKMRLKAIEMGLTLSEYGLENKVTGEKVTARSEEEIFRALGMEYLEPWQR